MLCPPLEPALCILMLGHIDFRSNKPTDIISTLVSIYDSKDLFVKELQVLLAQRLLAVTDGNYEKEVRGYRNRKRSRSLKLGIQRRNIEILKIRFGEAALQVCEVMLRDMTDSRRIDQHVQAQKPVRAQIVTSVKCDGILTARLDASSSHHRFASLLAAFADEQFQHARPVQGVCRVPVP